jgi:hypothetical protein
MDLVFLERPLSERSRKMYESYYRHLSKLNEIDSEDWITLSSENRLLNLLNENYENPNTKKCYLNLCIIIKKMNKQHCTMLLNEFARTKKRISERKEEQRIKFKESLPTFEQIKEFVDNQTDPVAYIVNHLCFYSCVRNQDLQMKIVSSESIPPEKLTNPECNYMVVMKSRVKFIIMDYKTVKTNGIKTFFEEGHKFLRCAKELLEKNQEWLLIKEDSEKVPEDNQCHFIKKLLYPEMTERLYCKIMVSNIITSNNRVNEKLTKISERRGTNIETLMSDYLLN